MSSPDVLWPSLVLWGSSRSCAWPVQPWLRTGSASHWSGWTPTCSSRELTQTGCPSSCTGNIACKMSKGPLGQINGGDNGLIISPERNFLAGTLILHHAVWPVRPQHSEVVWGSRTAPHHLQQFNAFVRHRQYLHASPNAALEVQTPSAQQERISLHESDISRRQLTEAGNRREK